MSSSAEDSPAAEEVAPGSVRRTADALLDAADRRDWDALAALLPADGQFSSNFGGETDHIGHYQRLTAEGSDVLAILGDLLDGTPLQDPNADLWVWPAEHLTAAEYLGWRVGVTGDGTWRFFVAGD